MFSSVALKQSNKLNFSLEVSHIFQSNLFYIKFHIAEF